MSQENVEIARRAYEAWNQGEYEEFFAAIDPEIELVLPEGGMTAGAHRGLQAMRQFLESYVESFEDFRWEPEEFFEAGDQVVTFLRVSGRGRGSGVELTVRPVHLLTIHGGRLQRVEAFPERDRRAVLKAVGLAE
ncbi:MAG TPA: nuclear transport factor 2 family protein [Thermoleophilaceae bacterium]|nr:nuclear transport factor 2 family protein [Thermoleophilaceae bacterium]